MKKITLSLSLYILIYNPVEMFCMLFVQTIRIIEGKVGKMVEMNEL